MIEWLYLISSELIYKILKIDILSQDFWQSSKLPLYCAKIVFDVM